MTDDQIRDIWTASNQPCAENEYTTGYLPFARAIERKIRATEGQAQTSAAVWNAAIAACHAEMVESTGTEGDIAYNKAIVHCVDAIRAAQLADSTAPGAPVDASWMTSDLSFVLAHLKENTIFDTARIDREWKEMKALAIKALAAPTAQQSLTAGGAVPDLPQLPEPLEIDWPELHSSALGCGVEDRNIHDRYQAAEYGWQDGVDKAIERVPDGLYDAGQMQDYAREAIKFAAAPLPQVQSEGLDAARLQFLIEHSAWLSFSKDGESCRVFKYSDEEGRAAPMLGWGARRWHQDPREAIDAAMADQQPVTPSGAPNEKQRAPMPVPKDAKLWGDGIWRDSSGNTLGPSGALADNDGGVA